MKILVCVKQVPDMEAALKPDQDGAWIDERDVAFRMNEYDEYAVEQAVRTKEQLGAGTEITVCSIGPARVTEAVRKALAMGADRGVHIRDDASPKKDPWQIASVIAAFAREQGFDLIFTGMQSQDRGSAQVGALVAAELGYACATTAVSFSIEGNRVAVGRELEGGVKMIVKLQLPAVVTCQLGLNVPRYPTLPNIMKAKQKELRVLDVSGLPSEPARTVTEAFYRPEKKSGTLVLEGDIGTMADQLAAMLKEKILRS